MILTRPLWRTLIALITILLLVLFGHAVWSPGQDLKDGRHDLGHNAIWLQHGWLGHDTWFAENGKSDRLRKFRDPAKIRALAESLRRNHITDVFPHLCPTRPSGEIVPVDEQQTELFLDEFKDLRVMPWVGGVIDQHVTPDDAEQRKVFVQSVVELLRKHPRLAGIHLNVEPWPSGHRNMLVLLDEVHSAIPEGKILSVAAYPPPTFWHRAPEVHWEEAYFKEVAQRVDQMAVMMYDTALRDGKLYQNLMRSWTRGILDWTTPNNGKRPPEILLGVPTYDDAGVGYHNPKVENLSNALLGIHSGLSLHPRVPAHYQGVAVYCEWETTDDEWTHWREHFLKP